MQTNMEKYQTSQKENNKFSNCQKKNYKCKKMQKKTENRKMQQNIAFVFPPPARHFIGKNDGVWGYEQDQNGTFWQWSN